VLRELGQGSGGSDAAQSGSPINSGAV